MALAILTRGLTRRFGDLTAVNELDLEIETGTVFGFLGHNGAGKTTTVRLLNGVLAPTTGEMTVLGLSPVTQGAELRRKTGVLTETPSLEERLTGRENLKLYAELYDVLPAQVDERVQELLETFQLADRAEDKVGSYSKGMHQRLALARALLHNPEILFLDEPTSGLDPVATRQVHNLIRERTRQGQHTVFLCTHNLDEAQQLCDRVAVLEHGRVIAQGTPQELARQMGRSIRLDIEVGEDSVQTAAQILNGMTQLPDAHVQGQTLTIPGADRADIPSIVSNLALKGVRIYRVMPNEPSLEDVYFRLHDKELGR